MSVDKIYEDLKKKYQRNDSFVIVIDSNGHIEEDNLEGKPYNHGLSTNYLAMKLGCHYLDSSVPYEAGVNLGNQGYLVVHVDYSPYFEEGICLCFFPEEITLMQYEAFVKRMKGFDQAFYQYFGNLNEEGFLCLNEVTTYAKGLVGDPQERVEKQFRRK